MSDIGISALELVVAGLVLASVAITWVINRTRRREKQPIQIQTEILAIILTIAAVVVIAIARSGVVDDDPLLFIVAVVAMIAASVGIIDSYLTWRVRKDLITLSSQLGSQVAGLGNLTYFPTKQDTYRELTLMTLGAREKLLATRYSPGDISTEPEYWNSIKQIAMDPRIWSIRIHCLAHPTSVALDGVCKLISELRGAPRFIVGVTFQNNNFEMIIADDKDCIFCFHDLQMTIKNGFRVDTTLPSSAHVVDNMGATYRRMMDTCYVTIDFNKFVRTDDDVHKLQSHLTRMHQEYCRGVVPKPVHPSDMESFLRDHVFA